MNWNDLYNDSKFCLKEPAEEVVKIAQLLQVRKARRVLDLGFGAGRHVIYLANLGFEMYRTDISQKGEMITRKWFEEEKLQAELVISDMTVVPYMDNLFD